MTYRLHASEVVIGRRFCGPPEVANGGYVAGLMAELAGEAVEVTLRAPAPLERALQVTLLPNGGVELHDGGTLIAEARRHEPHVEVPVAPSFADATRAHDQFQRFLEYQFSGCFVCGTDRRAGDGLRVQPGPLREPHEDVVAAPWVPDLSLTGEGEVVLPRYLWAALDCSGAYALHNQGDIDGHLVLGRMAARVIGSVDVGEKCVVIGWPLAAEGRKLHAATALLDGRGWVVAVSRQTWLSAAGKLPDS